MDDTLLYAIYLLIWILNNITAYNMYACANILHRETTYKKTKKYLDIFAVNSFEFPLFKFLAFLEPY